MIYNKIVTNDNRTILSSNIYDLSLTTETNTEDRVYPGSVISSMVSANLYGDYTDWEETESFILYSSFTGENDSWVRIGEFFVRNVKSSGKNKFSVEAYDCISLLEKSVVGYFKSQGWTGSSLTQKTLFEAFSEICTYCGVTAEPLDTVGNTYRFPKFTYNSTDFYSDEMDINVGMSMYSDWDSVEVSGRDAISWIAQLCGAFAIVNPTDGKLQLTWYGEGNISWLPKEYESVTKNGSEVFENVSNVVSPSSADEYGFYDGSTTSDKNALYYKQGSLSFEQYTSGDDDYCVVLNDEKGENVYFYPVGSSPSGNDPKYVITGNRFACKSYDDGIEAFIMTARIKQALDSVIFTPFSSSLFSKTGSIDDNCILRALSGYRIGVVDYNGSKFSSIVTKCVRTSSSLSISSEGESGGGIYSQSVSDGTDGYSSAASMSPLIVHIYDDTPEADFNAIVAALNSGKAIFADANPRDIDEADLLVFGNGAVDADGNYMQFTFHPEFSFTGSYYATVSVWRITKSNNTYSWAKNSYNFPKTLPSNSYTGADQYKYPSLSFMQDRMGYKQNILISGSNIKTINATSLLGSGNIQVIPTGGTAGQVLSKIDGTDYNTEWVDAGSGSTSESTENKVTSWSATPTDTHYPSEKLVYDTIGDVSDLMDALLNGVS